MLLRFGLTTTETGLAFHPNHFFVFDQTLTMAQQDSSIPTTNAKDQAEVAKLKQRLETISRDESFSRVPSVSIDDGAHKYVLISAVDDSGEQCDFVVSKRGASYHRNAAEPMVERLGSNGYKDISIRGGGRIFLDEDNKKISIFGFSYGFGQADHDKARTVVLGDDRYKDYEVTTSNEGY